MDNTETQLLSAIQAGNIDVVKELISQNPSHFNSNAGFGRSKSTPLMFACQKGIFEIVEVLIQFGADINKQDEDGDSALTLSSSHKNTNIAKLLLNNGANVDHADKNGITPLIIACLSNRVEMVQLLIHHKANINLQDRDGWTALMYTCIKNNINNMNILLDNGADIHVQDKKGRNLFMFACQYAFDDIVEISLKQKINVDAQDCESQTALTYAFGNGHYGIVMKLLQAKADINYLFKVPINSKNPIYDETLKKWIEDHQHELTLQNLSIWKKYRLQKLFA